MTTTQLYINDQLVDLSDDSPIALTFQINNLADVKNQQGNTSNQFKLPLTQRNRIILGFPDDVAFCTDLPYKQYQAKLVQDGLEIIPYGIGELNGIDQNSASITILSGNVDFFDAIDGKLYDMGDSTSQWSNYGKSLLWAPFDHEWNLDNAAGSQTKTDGWIWPVVDYGAFTSDFSAPINVQLMRPAFFIKTAIELMVQSAGYKATGSLLSDPLYPLLLCQFSNGSFEHGTNYQNQVDANGFAGNTSSTIMLSPPNQNNDNDYFSWDVVTADPGQQLNSEGIVFTSKTLNEVNITVTIPKIHLHGRAITDHNNPSTLTIHIFYRDPKYPTTPDVQLTGYDFSFDGHPENKYGNNPTGWTRVQGTSGGNTIGDIDILNAKLSFQTELPVGGGIFIGHSWQGEGPATATISPGVSLTIVSEQHKVQYHQTIQCERIFPDISQKDLLKDTLQRFGIICQTDNATKTIAFNSFRDIVNNIPVAKDWSPKCLDQGKQVSFQLGNYAQVNYLQYKDDDNVLPLKYGWSQITIADQTLPATAELFTSQFAATLNTPYYGGTIAQVKMIDDTSNTMDFSVGVVPRILIDQKLRLDELRKTVTFTDNEGKIRIINDVISTPYFYKPDAPEPAEGYGPASLLFDDLRKKYYPELEKILYQTKKVVRYILLTPRDILELDLLIPVYIRQDGCYYYINKIDAWRKGQPAKVELVKLG